MLPFQQAKKVPILFYGKVKFSGLNGKVIINIPVKTGMIGFGRNLEIIKSCVGRSEISINGTFTINGCFNAGNDYIIHVLKGAFLEIGEGSYLGSQTKIIATNKVKIGKGFRFGYESQISDSNYHYTIDLISNKVSKFKGTVEIGDYCWVGNRTSILKGTKTPQYLIVGSNSLLNKDYSKQIVSNSLIAGIPAKFIKGNIVRVFDKELEKEIDDYFAKNPDQSKYSINKYAIF
jgi:acetyltransferase-like isoleucine patch superfamily enzyme